MATVQEETSHMVTVSDQVKEAYADCWDLHPWPTGPYINPDWERVARLRNLEFLATRYLPRDDAQAVLEQWVKQYNGFKPSLLSRLPEDCEVRIAREGSVCLYVKSKAKLPTAKRMAADERDEMMLQSSRVIRYWWD